MATVGSLIAARMLQAIGASAGIVVGRAIIRDLFDRNRAAAMIGLVATVMVVVPTFGPLIGGLLDTAFGWESIFLFTAVTSGMVVVIWAAVRAAGDARPERAAGRAAGLLRATLQRLIAQREVRRLCLRRRRSARRRSSPSSAAARTSSSR